MNGVRTGSDEAFDFEVLLEGFKEHLDLPTFFVDGSDRGGTEVQVIGQQHQRLFAFNVDNDATELKITAILTPPLAIKVNDLVFKNISMLGKRPRFLGHPVQVGAQAGHKEDTGLAPFGKQFVVNVAHV